MAALQQLFSASRQKNPGEVLMNSVRIGNGCGFWGDNLDAPIILAREGRLDYLTLDYLAELTMSILALQKQRDPEAGFATDFLDVLLRLTPVLQAQPKLKIVTNGGGMNPVGCAAKARAILDQAGLRHFRIATITGDDLLPRLDALLADGNLLANLDTCQPLAAVRGRVVSANAYLGAQPIVAALDQGASICISGRVADASLTVGPAAARFRWAWDAWDQLAGATVAGHIIECGAQASGGLWCNWREAPDLGNVGYPIAQIEANGSFSISKPPKSGGAVNLETISEQILYEVGDPAAYLTPDVVANFTSVKLEQLEPDVVRVGQAQGKKATDTYKVSISYRDGFMASGMLVLLGPDAEAKARLCGKIVLERLQRGGVTPERSNIEVLGAGAVVPGVVRAATEPPEVVLRVSIHDSRKAAVERFSKEFAPLVTSGTPGVTGYTTGRPTVREVFAYWPALIPKYLVKPEVRVDS
jgi:Acyclic terpene utilisation family protein AtuA